MSVEDNDYEKIPEETSQQDKAKREEFRNSPCRRINKDACRVLLAQSSFIANNRNGRIRC